MKFQLVLARLKSQIPGHHQHLLMSTTRSYASIAARNGDNKDPTGSGDKSNRPQPTRHLGTIDESGSNESDDSNRSASSSKRSEVYTAPKYQRKKYQTPNVEADGRAPYSDEECYILTLVTDQPLHDYMTKFRTKYFPVERNHLDAHLTLFHALPGSQLDKVTQDIRSVCRYQFPFPVYTGDPVSPQLKTILVPATSRKHALQNVRRRLRDKWSIWLSKQDSGIFRPHYTVLNQVAGRENVKQKLEECKGEYEKKTGRAIGLALWRYDRPNWVDKKFFKFEDVENDGDEED